VISTVVLSWGHVLPNSQLLQVKIALLLPLPQRLQPFVMQQVNPHSYTAAKEISVSASLLLNDFQVYATLFLLEHR
jgi:hypothetical protein